MSQYTVEMVNITKKFGDILANNKVCLQLKKGEIHALLGENGAGKSTLMSILFGMYQPDEGYIKKDGKIVEINSESKVLIVGLGNNKSTPDALGPLVIDNILITNHLFEYSNVEDGFIRTFGIKPGVFAATGIETSDIVFAIKNKIDVDYIIVVDALASSDSTKVNKTIQITDTGISPGSGVGNKRKEISFKTFGIPVIAIGVPTVVDASTLTTDILEQLEDHIKKQTPDLEFLGTLGDLSKLERKQLLNEALVNTLYEMMVTPKEIDEVIEDLSKIIASSIDIAIHDKLRQEYLN